MANFGEYISGGAPGQDGIDTTAAHVDSSDIQLLMSSNRWFKIQVDDRVTTGLVSWGTSQATVSGGSESRRLDDWGAWSVRSDAGGLYSAGGTPVECCRYLNAQVALSTDGSTTPGTPYEFFIAFRGTGVGSTGTSSARPIKQMIGFTAGSLRSVTNIEAFVANGSTGTYVDTGIPLDGLNHRYEVFQTGTYASGSILYYIDGSLVAEIDLSTANKPAAGYNMTLYQIACNGLSNGYSWLSFSGMFGPEAL